MSKSQRRSRNRAVSILVALAMIVATNIAVSYASAISHERTGVTVQLLPPKPSSISHERTGVTVQLLPPKP
jgi:hypothetical protein